MPTDEDKTPVTSRERSEEAGKIRRLLDTLRTLEEELRPAASILDAISGDDRRAFAAKLVKELRQVGDYAHDAARAVRDLLRG